MGAQQSADVQSEPEFEHEPHSPPSLTSPPSSSSSSSSSSSPSSPPLSDDICILYATQTGTAKKYAHELKNKIVELANASSSSSFPTSSSSPSSSSSSSSPSSSPSSPSSSSPSSPSSSWLKIDVRSMSEFDPEDLPTCSSSLFLFLCSSFLDGRAPSSSLFFTTWLHEARADFRLPSSSFLSHKSFAHLGLASSDYAPPLFNAASKTLEEDVKMLGGGLFCASGVADAASGRRGGREGEEDVEDWWREELRPALEKRWALQASASSSSSSSSSSASSSAARLQSSSGAREVREEKQLSAEEKEEAEDAEEEEEEEEEEDEVEEEVPEASVDDLEELGPAMRAIKVQQQTEARAKRLDPSSSSASSAPAPSSSSSSSSSCCSSQDGGSDGGCCSSSSSSVNELPSMLTPKLRAALGKQHYSLIGSHSAVKLCRWTKAHLRARGGCYKNAFFGILSSRCMEMTPSLACANKCTFCWRIGTNPVGKQWKWRHDSPEFLLEHALLAHRRLIAELRGVPGVEDERFVPAVERPRHCALSLVGEPLLYPHITQLTRLMHQQHISTFLVGNAQFPQQLAELTPVTQLYVSIDAATQQTLKLIDRPLHSDFWTRFLDSLAVIATKKQRTVYRLTLIKEQNMSSKEIENYVKLIAIGKPTFVELKGVTFCRQNTGKGSETETKAGHNVTLKSVPFQQEVVEFAQRMICELHAQNLHEYAIACEHEHSNSILIAHSSLRNEQGQWCTWIDYERFHELVAEYYRNGTEFCAKDYSIPTPSWALWGDQSQGFNPSETRAEKHKKSKRTRAEAQVMRLAEAAAEQKEAEQKTAMS